MSKPTNMDSAPLDKVILLYRYASHGDEQTSFVGKWNPEKQWWMDMNGRFKSQVYRWKSIDK